MVQDFADFLAALNSEGAVYVVIGGMAVVFHVPYRTTRDIDVLIEPTLENAEKVRRALEKWGGFRCEFSAEELISGDIFSFGGLLRVEVHSRVPGASWEQVFARKVPGTFAGVPTFFASVDDLVAMKKAAGRADKDLPDLKRLERLLAKRGGRKPTR
ncbi:MAG: nucleotidyl transferase AbiEii/AbiGii toxin family protein [Thermoanaerobaculum sp.]